MNILSYNCYLINEEGEQLSMKLNDGAPYIEVQKWEKENGIFLPEALKELLLFSNGLSFFGLRILGLSEIEYFEHCDAISFHDWGNGDFDLISLGHFFLNESILFHNHEKFVSNLICNDLFGWFEAVFNEIKQYGCLFHPMDKINCDLQVLYSKINI